MSSILSMEETIRTSQFECVHTVSCRAFHGGSFEKESKFYHLPVQRYLQN